MKDPVQGRELRVGQSGFKLNSSAKPPTKVRVRTPADATKPLIPTRWVSVPNQRLAVVALFMALQAHKILVALEDGPSPTSFVFYSLLDAAGLWLLPVLSIPWLRFKPWATMLFVTCAVLVNVVLFVNHTLLAMTLAAIGRLALGKEISISGKSVPTWSEHAYGSKHLQGKYVVTFLPESSATMVADEALCLAGAEPVYVHVMLNSTEPSLLSLVGKPFTDTGDLFAVDFTKAQLASFPTKHSDGSLDMWVPVSQPGIYKLSSLKDSSTGLPVKTRGPALVIPPCPAARFSVSAHPICAGEPFDTEIEVVGVGQLKVQFEGGTTVTTLAAENSELSTFRVPVSFKRGAGTSTLAIESVVDGIGNTIAVHEEQIIRVLGPGDARFEREDKLALTSDHVSALVDVRGEDPPFVLSYTCNGDDREVTLEAPGKYRLKFEEEGKYRLAGLKGSTCKGKATGQIEVFVPPPVELSVDFEQISDKCTGPRGIDADVLFKGTPPFEVWYKTSQNGKVISENTFKSKTFHGQVHFKPSSLGTFDYEFTAVADKYRRVDLQGQPGFHEQQTINEIAGASFGHDFKTKYCAYSTIVVPAKVQGKGPLTLTYTVDGREFTEEGIDGDVSILLGKLAGGSHQIKLTGIKDSRGCSTPLDILGPQIVVRSALPTIGLSGERSIKVSDLSAPPLRLPLEVQDGEPPFLVKYRINGGRILEQSLNEPYLPVSKPGTYELVDFQDECPGAVVGETVSVSLYERPKLQLVTHDELLCVGRQSEITMALSGNPPFKLGYEGIDPRGHTHYEEISTAQTEVKIKVPAHQLSGNYTNYFWLSDHAYPDFDKSRAPLRVTQLVHAEPAASFADPKASYKICALASHKGIPLVLKGKAPYSITLEVENSGTGETFTVKETVTATKKQLLSTVFDKISVGRYKVRLVGVIDGTGCRRRIAKSESNQVTIVRYPLPSISDLKDMRAHYCVGEHVELDLSGQGPFTLEYSFNGRKTSATTGPHFSRLASTPGVLKLTQLKDSVGCDAVLDDVADIVVHDQPGSRITKQENFSIQQGDSVELQFEFSGVAPFVFTYTRTLHGKVLETKTVKSETHTHSILTDEDGVYEVIALADAYCRVSL